MAIRSILVPICPEIASDAQLLAALGIARREEAHVSALHVRPDSAAVLAGLPAVALRAGVTAEMIEREACEAAAVVRSEFDGWCRHRGLPVGEAGSTLRSTFATWSERIGRLETAILQAGRLSDLVVIGLPSAEIPASERVFDAAVFETGRPVLMVPRVLPDELLRHIVVAWNGSLEATRAVAGAMPLLRTAERVSVFTAPGHGDDLLAPEMPAEGMDLPAALGWHGIHAHALRPQKIGQPVAEALMQSCTDHAATLLVMGGFTRSRIRDVLLGGVTRFVLGCSTIPVLMAH